jgi:hypothetical protein
MTRVIAPLSQPAYHLGCRARVIARLRRTVGGRHTVTSAVARLRPTVADSHAATDPLPGFGSWRRVSGRRDNAIARLLRSAPPIQAPRPSHRPVPAACLSDAVMRSLPTTGSLQRRLGCSQRVPVLSHRLPRPPAKAVGLGQLGGRAAVH